MVNMVETTLEQKVLEIALEELAGAEDTAYAGLPWNAVYKAFKEFGMEAEPAAMEPFCRKLMAEGKRWQKAALQRLWSTLGISMSPRVHECLEGENWSTVSVVYRHKKTPQIRVGLPYTEPLVFPLPQPHPSGDFAISTWPGGIEVKLKGLYARKEKAYLMSLTPLDIRSILAGVRSFTSLLAFLGLADLERGLTVLDGLRDGEVRQEGAYLLARQGSTRLLFRGSLTGDPGLDAALLLGREVAFGDGKIRLRVKVGVGEEIGGPRIWIEEGSLDWEEEAVPLASSSGAKFSPLERNALAHLIRTSLCSLRGTSLSPRMRGLVEELANSDPLEALKTEDLPLRVYMRLLSHY
jgi:hypothetical protein